MHQLTVVKDTLVRSKTLHAFFEEALQEYAIAAEYTGAMYLEQSDRVVEDQGYQWESSGGSIEEPRTLLLAFVLEQQGLITEEQATELVGLHFANLSDGELPEFAQVHFEMDEDGFFLDDELEFRDLMTEIHWELIALRDHALRLTYTAYDQIGADGSFNRTSWFTKDEFRDICNDTQNIFKHAHGGKYEDYDMFAGHVNPIRGGGFSCTKL